MPWHEKEDLRVKSGFALDSYTPKGILDSVVTRTLWALGEYLVYLDKEVFPSCFG